jgi:hypothetical protein
LSNYLKEEKNETRKIRYFAQDESRFGINTIIGRFTRCATKNHRIRVPEDTLSLLIYENLVNQD